MNNNPRINMVIEHLSRTLHDLCDDAREDEILVSMMYVTSWAALTVLGNDVGKTSEFLRESFSEEKVEWVLMDKVFNQIGREN